MAYSAKSVIIEAVLPTDIKTINVQDWGKEDKVA